MTRERKEAIEQLKWYFEEDDGTGSDSSTKKAYEVALEALKEEPRIKAEWIDEPNCWYRCSHCGSHYPSIIGIMEYNYCPDCGADMRKEE